MKTLKIIGLAVLAFLLLLVAAAYLLPRHIHVERSSVINTRPEAVFSQVNILKNWENWSPWHEIDPQMQIVYEGPEMGAGASYSWFSDDPSAGTGKLTILESHPFSLIRTEIDFMERGTATALYTFTAVSEGTLMTWSMQTDMGNNPVSRYFGLLMDKWLGRDFEKGMARLQEYLNTMPDDENAEAQGN